MIYHWIEAAPHSEEVNVILDKIRKLIRKHSFDSLLEPDPKITGYVGNRNLPVAATFMLLFYLTQRCWDLFSEKEFEEELFPEYTEEYKRMEDFIEALDLNIVMNSMFDIIQRTVGAEFLVSFWQQWEEENKNSEEVPEDLIRSFNEQLIVNFMSLRGLVDACFFIFNDCERDSNLSSDHSYSLG